MTFITEYRKSDGFHYVLVPAEVKAQFAGRGTVRVIATIGALEPFQGGLMPTKSGEGFLMINKARQKVLGLRPGDPVTVTILPDESEYGAPMPEELEALLAQDDEAKRRFDALTPGKKRELMFSISRLKGVEKRIDKALKLLLEPGKGPSRW